jgi:hypothetical protein
MTTRRKKRENAKEKGEEETHRKRERKILNILNEE